MAKLTPREIAEKQVRRSQGASEDYVRGVRSVTEAPTQKAKTKKDKLKANFNAAVDSGKWEAGLDSVSLDDWQRATETKGSARYGAGVAEAADKIAAFHEEFQPFLEGVKKKVADMPDTTMEQRLQRMMENARSIAKFARTRRRR